jgi:hypothetical protein
MPATPTTSEEKTSGTTIISSRRRKSVPTGSVMRLIVHTTRGSSPPSTRFTTTPATTPTRSPMTMRVCSGIPFGLSGVASLRSVVSSRS